MAPADNSSSSSIKPALEASVKALVNELVSRGFLQPGLSKAELGTILVAALGQTSTVLLPRTIATKLRIALARLGRNEQRYTQLAAERQRHLESLIDRLVAGGSERQQLAEQQ